MAKLNLIGNINIKDSDNYQFLYASQSYQTLYSIYGKFKGAKIIEKQGKDFLNIDILDLYLVNYQGHIDIGFHQGGFRSELKKETDNNGDIIISSPIELEENEPDINQHNIPDFDYSPDKENAFFELRGLSNHNRKRYTNLTFELTTNQNLILYRTLKELNNGNHFNGRVFDSEFFVRDGIDDLPSTRPQRRGHGKKSYRPRLISGNCIETVLKILS